MSTIIVIAPLVVTSWPLITAAVTASVSALGYAVVKDANVTVEECVRENKPGRLREEIALENSEILAGAHSLGETMTIEKDGVRATFHRDVRGSLRLAVEGVGYTKEQLRQIGQELIGRVTQQYAYHRLVTEMKQRGMSIVEETVEEDNTVKIRVRNY